MMRVTWNVNWRQDGHIYWDATRPSCTNMLALDEMDETGR